MLILKEEMEASLTMYFTDDGSFGNGFVTENYRSVGRRSDLWSRLCDRSLVMMRAVTNVTRPYNIRPLSAWIRSWLMAPYVWWLSCSSRRQNSVHLCRWTRIWWSFSWFDSVLKRNNAYRDDDDCRLEAQIADPMCQNCLKKLLFTKNSVRKCLNAGRLQNPQFRRSSSASLKNKTRRSKPLFALQRAFCVEAALLVNIPEFIAHQRRQICWSWFEDQRQLTSRVCGLCPQSDQCEGSCILGQRSADRDWFIGTFCLDILAEAQLEVTAPTLKKNKSRYDRLRSCQPQLCGWPCQRASKLPYLKLYDYGGVLRYGIPEFRLQGNRFQWSRRAEENWR